MTTWKMFCLRSTPGTPTLKKASAPSFFLLLNPIRKPHDTRQRMAPRCLVYEGEVKARMVVLRAFVRPIMERAPKHVVINTPQARSILFASALLATQHRLHGCKKRAAPHQPGRALPDRAHQYSFCPLLDKDDEALAEIGRPHERPSLSLAIALRMRPTMHPRGLKR